jgi:hypothetical protein
MATQPSGKLQSYFVCLYARMYGNRADHARWGGDHCDYWETVPGVTVPGFDFPDGAPCFRGKPLDHETIVGLVTDTQRMRIASMCLGLTQRPGGDRCCFVEIHVRVPTVTESTVKNRAKAREELKESSAA